LVILALLAIPYQWVSAPFTHTRIPSPEEAAVISDLEQAPEASYVVSDDAGLVWFGSRNSHPTTVDSSHARIETESLSPDDVLAALNDPSTCAYLEFSGRYDGLDVTLPSDYGDPLESGLLLRDGC
jgi:hypothetical protein